MNDFKFERVRIFIEMDVVGCDFSFKIYVEVVKFIIQLVFDWNFIIFLLFEWIKDFGFDLEDFIGVDGK